MKFWIAHTVSGFRFRCCSHCFVRGSCFISVLCIYVRATVTWCVSSVKQEQPTLSEISLILWVRVWFSVSCFVDICLYFCPLAITLPTLLRITPLLSSKYSGGQFNVHCLLICSRPFKCQISPFNIQVIRLFTTGQYSHLTLQENRIGRVMVSVLALSSVDRGFEPWSGKTKDYQIGMCCFSAKHEALRRKSKDWLAQIQKNVSKWRDMSTRGLLFQWTSTMQIQLSVLVK